MIVDPIRSARSNSAWISGFPTLRPQLRQGGRDEAAQHGDFLPKVLYVLVHGSGDYASPRVHLVRL